MAHQESSPALSGAARIRSLRDQDSVFEAFDAYPWTKDLAFLSGLRAILGEPNPDNPRGGSPRDMATHARIFYYAQRIGVQLDFGSYHAWLAQCPHHQPPDVLPQGYGSPSSQSAQQRRQHQQQHQPTATAWQQAAPKADLYVDRSAAQSRPSSGNGNGDGGEPNYPMAFAEMIKLLQEGKPIPGIRQIPNTIERDPSVKPVGSQPVPRKPWERDPPAAAPEPLELEFPPVQEQAAAMPTAEAA